MSTIAATARPARASGAMSPWRLELLRMVRSPRAIALGAVYLFFGLLGPIMTKYMQDIVNRFQSGVTIVVAHPTPQNGIANYIGQASQTGLIVVVVVAAGALTFDSRRGLSTFLRTRADNMWQLVAPRFTVSATAAVAAYTLGTLGAWYETTILLGSLPAPAMLAGMLCGSVFLVFAVSVAAAAASLARGTLGAVGIAIGVLLVLPIIGVVGPLGHWLPSALVTAPVQLLGSSSLGDYVPALAVAGVASVVLLAAATWQLGRREV